MCGIIGVIGHRAAAPFLIQGIARLEYRGYDSCGVATLNSRGIELRKDVGPVTDVASRRKFAAAHGTMGIAHTRWATHGGVSAKNAHPHLSCDRAFAVVHNGIIVNHDSLRSELEACGHHFASETDTEVVPHLIEELYDGGVSVEEAFVRALRRLEGTFALALVSVHDREHVFCARQKSPLILGIGAEANFIGSDVNAFLPFTRRAVVLEDGEYAVISNERHRIRTIGEGTERHRSFLEIAWKADGAERGKYRHYMEKEIREQPEILKRVMEVPQSQLAALSELMCASRTNIFVGVGTTYYVALFGQYLMASLAGEVAPAISSDEALALARADSDTLVLAISQSGETFDTLQALREAKKNGARTAAIVNVPGSSMTREADVVIPQNSGPEICVISTKAALAQMALLCRLVVEVACRRGTIERARAVGILDGLASLPELVETLLRTRWNELRGLAHRYCRQPNWFFLSRGIHTPAALESALKMKEVTYLHAEGMPAGFLKHGTLSLVEPEYPCVFLMPQRKQKNLYDVTLGNAEEVRARGGRVIGLAFDRAHRRFDEEIILPDTDSHVAPLLQLVAGQVLAYEAAVALGRNIDRPRSLAKSVTVS